jgi:predicted ribonuclease YlaK
MQDDRLFRCFKKNVCDQFKRFGEDVSIYLRSTKSKGDNYDPIRNTGYAVGHQNPISIKAWVRQPSQDGKLLQQIGLVENHPMEIIVFEKDINTVIEAERLVIKGKDYHVRSDAVGNRVSKIERIYGLARIIIWIKEGDC